MAEWRSVARAVVALLGLGALVHGIAYSASPIRPATLALLGGIAVFALGERRALLPFVIVPFGPLINVFSVDWNRYLWDMEALLLAVFGFGLLLQIRATSRPLASVWPWCASFVLAVGLAAAVHVLRGAELAPELRLARGPLFALLMATYLDSLERKVAPDCARAFFRASFASFAIVVVYVLVEYLHYVVIRGVWLIEPHPLFFYGSSEWFSLYLVLVLPCLALDPRLSDALGRAWRDFTWLLSATGGLLLLATLSRSALFASICVVLLFPFRAVKSKLVMGSALLAAVLLGASAIAYKTLGRGGDFTAATLFGSRLRPWYDGLQAVIAAPTFGQGPMESFYNVYLQMWAHFGAIVLVLFVTLVAVVLHQVMATARHRGLAMPQNGLLAGIVAYLIASLGQSSLNALLGYLFWFHLFAMAYFASGDRGALDQQSQRSASRPQRTKDVSRRRRVSTGG